jgi:TolA-binding protein
MKQFVTRAEFEALKKAVGVKSSSKSSSVNVTKENKSTSKKLNSTDKKALSQSAKSDYKKRNFTKAIPKFEALVESNYKPAEGNYYLAEMWYVRKKYDLAISHFKKSAILYDQAAYMPTLLLHSAISFEKTKDKENAKSFYSTLIDLYPDSSESKVAEKNLSKL